MLLSHILTDAETVAYMKKLSKLLVIVWMFISLFSGCKNQVDGICPMSIKVDGQIYFCYDEIVESEDVEILGYITSNVDISREPEIDNQSNFSTCLNQPYGLLDGRMMIYYDDNWHKCYLPSEINDGSDLIEERETINISIAESKRISRREIEISWQSDYDEVVNAYFVMRRGLINGKAVGDWNTIATISSDKTADDFMRQYVDVLESDEPQQFEYRIDVEINDTENYVAAEGTSILASNVKVCIDPGHFNIAREVAEADEYQYVEGNAVLELGLFLRQILKEEYGIDTCMTRDSDSIELDGYVDDVLDSAHISLRGEYAAQEDCDMFISLHTNSNEENANDYPTYFQPIEINKPIIIINESAKSSDIAIRTANAIGANLTKVNCEKGLAVSDEFIEWKNSDISEWTKAYNDSLSEAGAVVCRTGKKGDYYGVLRGASAVNVPGMIIEHGFHSVQEVRKETITGDLIELWAGADAYGIAYGFGFTENLAK